MDTMKIKSGEDYAVINVVDFDSEKHTPYDDESKDKVGQGKSDAERYAEAQDEMRRRESNRGVGTGAVVTNDLKNPSGTFSEPTPSDIRFPDKAQTEFENNKGAFIDRSASDLRKERGLADKAGGIDPEGARATLEDPGTAGSPSQVPNLGGEKEEGEEGGDGEGDESEAETGKYVATKDRGRWYVTKDGERQTSSMSEEDAKAKATELNGEENSSSE